MENSKSEKREIIKRAFKEAGIPLTKIRRSRLNDGFYVYHSFCAYRPYNVLEEVSRNGTRITYRRVQKEHVGHDFIFDDGDEEMFESSLEIGVHEARMRAGLPAMRNMKISQCCNARMIAGTQCENCGSNGVISDRENQELIDEKILQDAKEAEQRVEEEAGLYPSLHLLEN